ncbi:MAG: glycosyltransferase [Promethearchaeota archaeon]
MKKKIRILYIITGLTPGGAELHLSKIINHLSLNEFETVVCSLTATDDILKKIKNRTNSVYLLDARKKRHFIKMILKVRKIIKIVNPDIIHCVMFHSNIIGRIAAIGLKKVIISSIRTKLISNKIGNFFDFISQPLVNYYFVNSISLGKFTSHYGIRKTKIKIIENGIDFNAFIPTKSKEVMRKELNLPYHPIVSTVANFKAQKDYPTIIKAIHLLKNEIEFTYLIIGKGLRFEDQGHRIKQLIKHYNLNNVVFLGYRDDIANILSITNIWVNSSIFEGQSNSLLEAMAMKLPIITTDIEENREITRHNREAILVPVNSPHMIAQSIKLLLEDSQLAKSIAENAYYRVKKKYNQEDKLNKLKNAYYQIYSQIKPS